MKLKKLSCLILIIFCFSIISPSIFVQAASAAAIDSIVTELANVYQYIDDADKPDIQAARTNLDSLAANPADASWDTIISPLMTPQVIAAFGDEATARTAMIQFAAGVGNMYYSSDAATLNANLTEFKETYTPTFQLLFGTDITMEELYQFLTAAQANLPNAIQGSPYFNDLAFGSNTQLVNAMPNVFKEAIGITLADVTFAKFSGKLGDLGWNEDILINQKTALSEVVDPSHAGELALAKAAVRSKTALASGMPTTIGAGRVIHHNLTIMGSNATNLVEWQSSDPNVVVVSTDPGTGNYVLTSKAGGTATLTAYRDININNPASSGDWIYQYNVTVLEYGNLNGDHLASGSSKVTAADALIVLQIASHTYTPTEQQKVLANVNGDLVSGQPRITAADALLVLQYASHTISIFPVE